MLLVALVCGPLAFAPAQAATSTISGRVLDVSGKAIDEVLVVVYVPNGAGDYLPDYELAVLSDESGRYTLDLDPGTYKLEFYGDDVHVPEFYDDASDLETATSVTVDGEGLALGDVELASWPTMKGAVKALDGTPITDGFVRAYTHDEAAGWVRYDDAELDEAGNYVLPVDPGAYRIGFFARGGQYKNEYWNDVPTIGQARDIQVREGDALSLNASLARVARGPLTNYGRPAADGFPAVGQVLRGGDGRWSATPASVSRQWLRNGAPIAGANGPDYRVTPADVGATLSVQVTAAADGFHPATAVSRASVPVRWTSKISARSKAGKKKATLKIVVTSAGGKPNGTVTIKLRNTKIKTVRLKNGKAKVTIKKLTRKHRYTVVYNYNRDGNMFGNQTSVWAKPIKKR